jgi:hypothetical protein
MYVSNVEDYGHLVNPEFYNPNLIHPEMYELLYNRLDWERRYISREYMENKTPEEVTTNFDYHKNFIISINGYCWTFPIGLMFKTSLKFRLFVR